MRLVVGGTATFAGDMRGGDDDGRFKPTRYDSESGDVRFEWRATRTGTLGVSVFVLHKDWPDNYTFPNRDQLNRRDREIAIARWVEKSCTPWWDEVEMRLALVHNGWTTDRRDRVLLTEEDVWSPQLDVIAHKALAGRRHVLTYGFHAHREIVDLLATSPTSRIYTIPQGYFQDFGLYLQDEWQVTPRLRLVGGLRFDVAHAHTDPEAATTDPLLTPDDVRIDQWDTAWTGKIGGVYDVTRCLNVTGNLTRGYRFPSLENLAGIVQHPDEVQIGDRDVKPEYSLNLELGAHLHTPRLRADVVWFQSWYQDLIVATYGTFHGLTYIDRNGNGMEDPDESLFLTKNAGTARTHGVELGAEYVVLPRWGLSVYGNFTWWRGTFHPDNTEPLGIPTNGTVGVRAAPCDRYWVEAEAHMVRKFKQIPRDFYLAEQFFFKDPQDESKGPLRSTPEVPGYTTFDVRGGAQLTKRVSVELAVENVLNRKYRPYASRHDGAGTTFLGTLTVDF